MANDDRSRREYYGDPQRALMKQDAYKSGCGACLHSVYDKLKFSWVCGNKVPTYPYETNDTCKSWLRKGKK